MKIPKKPSIQVVITDKEYRVFKTWAFLTGRDINDLLERYLPEALETARRELAELLSPSEITTSEQ